MENAEPRMQEAERRSASAEMAVPMAQVGSCSSAAAGFGEAGRWRSGGALFREALVEPSAHGAFGHRAAELGDRCAGGEELHIGDAAYAELLGELRVLVDIDGRTGDLQSSGPRRLV